LVHKGRNKIVAKSRRSFAVKLIPLLAAAVMWS